MRYFRLADLDFFEAFDQNRIVNQIAREFPNLAEKHDIVINDLHEYWRKK
jgi:hypothetical protein